MKTIQLRGKDIGSGIPPLICTPLVGKTPEAVQAELAAVLPKCPDVIEWRVDFFQDIGNIARVIEVAAAIRESAGAVPIIFTCRSINEGGERIPLNFDDVVKLYVAVCASRCVDFIDYELSNPVENIARLRDASRDGGVAMIMSYHNFQATPDAAMITGKFFAAERFGADVAKVAVMPKSPEDVLTLLGATQAASKTCEIPLISMSMGGIGSLSRIMGWVFGSALSFAVGKSSSAPGQIPIEELRSLLASTRRAISGS